MIGWLRCWFDAVWFLWLGWVVWWFAQTCLSFVFEVVSLIFGLVWFSSVWFWRCVCIAWLPCCWFAVFWFVGVWYLHGVGLLFLTCYFELNLLCFALLFAWFLQCFVLCCVVMFWWWPYAGVTCCCCLRCDCGGFAFVLMFGCVCLCLG